MAASYYFDEDTRFDFCSECHRMLPENEMTYFYGHNAKEIAHCDDCREEEEAPTDTDAEPPDAYDTMRFDPMESER